MVFQQIYISLDTIVERTTGQKLLVAFWFVVVHAAGETEVTVYTNFLRILQWKEFTKRICPNYYELTKHHVS